MESNEIIIPKYKISAQKMEDTVELSGLFLLASW